MKKILLLFILFTALGFSQIVRQPMLSDSLRAAEAMISDSVTTERTARIAVDDSLASDVSDLVTVDDSLASDIAELEATGFVEVDDSLASDIADLVVVDDSLASDIVDLITVDDSLVSDIAEKLDKDLSSNSLDDSPDGTGLIVFQYTSDTQYSTTLDNLPMPAVVSASQAMQDDDIGNLIVSVNNLLGRMDEKDDEIEAQQVIIDSLGVRIDALIPSFPIRPTEFLATATSVSNIDLTWEGGFRDYSAAIVYHSTSGVGYAELIRQDGEDSTYSHSSLNEGSLHYYYVTHYDSTLEQESAQSNIDTSTTFTTPSGGGNYIYVTADADGGGDGTEGEPYTLAQAITAAVAGDTVSMAIGYYSITSVTFGEDGTAENPIVWIGTISANDLGLGIGATINDQSDGSASTTIYSSTYANGRVSMNGDYNKFYKIVFQDECASAYGRNLIRINGDNVTMDSCAYKDSLNIAGDYHGVEIHGEYTHLLRSSFSKGPRCTIWSYDDADYLIIDGCTFTKASRHYPIQIMPNTSTDTSSTMSYDALLIKQPIVRNCYFINNPYGGCVYIRHCEQFAVYNNIAVNSGEFMNTWFHTGFHYPYGEPADTCNSKGGIYAYNTNIYNSDRVWNDNYGINQINFVNNLMVNDYPGDPYTYGINIPNGPMVSNLRHNFDYNIYYDPDMNLTTYWRAIWGGAGTFTFATLISSQSQEANSAITDVPTFADSSNGDYSPLSGSSPQVGAGTPVTIAEGYWMDITTDYFGNARDGTNPDIGAIEYQP